MKDFWWLTGTERSIYTYVDLVHHEPIGEEDDPPVEFAYPCLTPIVAVDQWSAQHQHTNVYRSLNIWKDKTKREAVWGPFVVDIDNDWERLNEKERLKDALAVTRAAVEYLLASCRIKERDLRVSFTGHKGFNLEILPAALEITGTAQEQEQGRHHIREEIISRLRQRLVSSNLVGKNRSLVSDKGTVIDPVHDYVRLHGSLNKWIEGGIVMARQKIGLTIGQLNDLPLEEIVARAADSPLR